MANIKPTARILSIATSTRGFGFAVLEGRDTVANWGGKRAEGGDKNKASIAKVAKLLLRYHPDVVVLEDTSAETSRRHPRIRRLTRQMIALAKSHKSRVELFSVDDIKKLFFAGGEGTKHEIAAIAAERFSEDTGLQLPPKRRTQDNVHPRMDVFDALALAMAYTLRQLKRTAYQVHNTR
jgi:Holliday junction resolvasome RuvABC endonuclease subunit